MRQRNGPVPYSSGAVRGVRTTAGIIEVSTLVLAGGMDNPRLAAMIWVNVRMKDSPGVLAHTPAQPHLLSRTSNNIAIGGVPLRSCR